MDKILIILSASSGGLSIISFTTVIGALAGIASASFTLVFSLTTGIIKKLLSVTRNKKKKHDKILMLAKKKLNSIKNLLSQALNEMKISLEEFITILKERDKYENMKETLRNINEKLKEKAENTRLNSVCIYQMVDIAVGKYTDVKVHTIRARNKNYFG